jgi:hypothetical protein
MEELRELIAFCTAYLAKRKRENEIEQEELYYAYRPVPVEVYVDERQVSHRSSTWRMY